MKSLNSEGETTAMIKTIEDTHAALLSYSFSLEKNEAEMPVGRRACVKAEVKPIQPKNATRHSFEMGLLGKGFGIWQVSKAMNHASISMTEKYVKMLAGEIDGIYGRAKTVPKQNTRKS